jgi:hypothetical protein
MAEIRAVTALTGAAGEGKPNWLAADASLEAAAGSFMLTLSAADLVVESSVNGPASASKQASRTALSDCRRQFTN